MKRLLSCLAALCLCASAAMAAPLEQLHIGDSREEIRQMMEKENITPVADGDSTMDFEADGTEINISFDEADKVNFIYYVCDRDKNTQMDFTRPDWTLTCSAILETLEKEGAAHEGYWAVDAAQPVIYVTCDFMGVTREVMLEFSESGLLAKVSVFDYDEAGLYWMSKAVEELGESDVVNRYYMWEDDTSSLMEEAVWMNDDGSYYTLTVTHSVTAYEENGQIKTVQYTETEISAFGPEE